MLIVVRNVPIHLPTLNKILNDEKKLSGMKDNENKLVIDCRMLVSAPQCNLLISGIGVSFVALFLRQMYLRLQRYSDVPSNVKCTHLYPVGVPYFRHYAGALETNLMHYKLEKMGSGNGTWLRFMKATIDPLRKMAQTLQGEKGVDLS